MHFARRLKQDDVEEGLTHPLADAPRLRLVDAVPEALAVADGMLAMRYVRAEEALVAAHASRGRGRAADRVAEAADRRAENPFESVVRALVIETGVGSFVPQVEIRLPRRVVRVDLAAACGGR